MHPVRAVLRFHKAQQAFLTRLLMPEPRPSGNMRAPSDRLRVVKKALL